MVKIQNSRQNQTSPLTRLRRRWQAWALIYGLTLGLGYWSLPLDWHQRGLALRWALLAAAVLAYLLVSFYRALPANHRATETELLPTLGPGNSLTLLRGLAVGLLAGFLWLPRPVDGLLAWMPASLYTFISVFDYLDGYTARVTNQATRLGEILDGICDALGLLVAVGLVVQYGQLPGWYLLVGLARYLYVFDLWWRQRRGQPIFELTPSRRRRLLAGFQMAFISVMLWPMFTPPATTLAGLVFAAPFLAGFGRDWLVVSGQLNPNAAAYQVWHRRVSVLLDKWLPSLLRAGLVLVAAGYLLPIMASPATRYLLLAWPGSPWPTLTSNLIALAGVIATGMLAVGLLARVAALALLFPTAMTLLAAGLNWANGSLLAGTILVMLYGGGKWAVWRLDDLWVTVRAGGRR